MSGIGVGSWTGCTTTEHAKLRPKNSRARWLIPSWRKTNSSNVVLRPSPTTKRGRRSCILSCNGRTTSATRGSVVRLMRLLFAPLSGTPTPTTGCPEPEVHAAVRALLPSHGPDLDDVIQRHTDRALSKLSSKSEGHRLIRHWQRDDK